ncbi:MAG: C40 family peptidase [Megasphaera elsdenii]|uniref:C40 family peptidase n=1 Tax=Megasphaera elsdenii TaxID=907 RepID=UPI003F085F0E
MLNYQDLVGIPFVDGGRTLQGFDCWGLVRYIYGQRGIQLPEYPIDPKDRVAVHRAMEAGAASCWQKVQHPKEGDVVLLELAIKCANHVGVYIGRGDFIHAYGTAVVIDRLSHWQSRVVGFYRPKEGAYD